MLLRCITVKIKRMHWKLRIKRKSVSFCKYLHKESKKIVNMLKTWRHRHMSRPTCAQFLSWTMCVSMPPVRLCFHGSTLQRFFRYFLSWNFKFYNDPSKMIELLFSMCFTYFHSDAPVKPSKKYNHWKFLKYFEN